MDNKDNDMMFDFYSDLGDISIDFDEDTGSFSLCGIAKPNTSFYNLLKFADSINNKINEAISLNSDSLNNLENTIQNFDILNKLKNNKFNRTTVSEKDKFFENDMRLIEDLPWLKENHELNKKVIIYKNPIDYRHYFNESELSLFTKEKIVDIRDNFLYHSAIHRNLFDWITDSNIFKMSARIMGFDISIFEFNEERKFASYRIILRSPDKDIYVFYIK